MSERACGREDCGTSTGIHEGLTFGYGRLNTAGFWQFPCRACAKEWDENIQKTRDELRDKMIAEGNLPLNVIQYILDSEWLNTPAWPYETTDIPAHIERETARVRKEDEEDEEWNRMFNDAYPTDPYEAA